MALMNKIKSKLFKNYWVFILCWSIAGLTFWAMYHHEKTFHPVDNNDGIIYQIESKILDLKFRLRGEEKPKAKVGILAIDEQSIAEFGYPVSRRFYKKAFDNLKALGVSWIGYDVIFAEPEIPALKDIKEDLNSILANPNDANFVSNRIKQINQKNKVSLGDRMLYEGINSFENIVMGYFFFLDEFEARANLGSRQRYPNLESMLSSEIPEMFMEKPENKNLGDFYQLERPKGLVSNTEFLTSSSNHFGYFSNTPDTDAVNRWVVLVADINGHLMPSLSLKLASEYLGRQIFVNFDEYGVNGIKSITLFDPEDLDISTTIPIDPVGTGRVLVNHVGGGQSFEHFSIADAVNNTFSDEQKERLKDSVLLVGATALGTNDIRPNPFDPNINGVENHAAVVENIISQDFMYKPKSSQFHEIREVRVIALIGLIFPLILSFTGALFSGLALVLFIGTFYLHDYFYVFGEGIWSFIGLPSIEIFAMFMITSLSKYFSEENEKKKIKGAFQHYLSSDVIEQILDDPDKLSLGGQKKELTVLFSDVRSFTTISESLSPEKLSELMNDYFTPMSHIIMDNKGVLDKYIGDAIMAFWGAPLELKNSADVGCKAAVEMMFALDKLNVDFKAKGFPQVDIGIGLNTGPMSVGNMGSDDRFTYTVMGDSVNLGSRLEGLTKEYGIKIMISRSTQEKLTPGAYFTRDLDHIRVKGKHEPVQVFEVIRPDKLPEAKLTEFCEMFSAARSAYRAKKWMESKKLFESCLGLLPEDKACELYLRRVLAFQNEDPGDDWDGVFTYTHK